MREIRTSLQKYIFRCIRCKKSRKLKQVGIGLTVQILFSHNNPNYVSKVIQKYKEELRMDKEKSEKYIIGYCNTCKNPVYSNQEYSTTDGLAHKK